MRCNLGARYRWGIKDSMNTEKKRGYCYEHAYAFNWNGMRCYHALMRIAHLLNQLALHSQKANVWIQELGIKQYRSEHILHKS